MNEISKETVFIDGTKLESCANKYTFVWKKSVGRWEEKMYSKIETAISLVNQEYAGFCAYERKSYNRSAEDHELSG